MPKPGKIQMLPPDIKKKVDKLLLDGKLQQADIVKQIKALLTERGLLDEHDFSYPTFNRYANRFHDSMQVMREARELAASLAQNLGDEPTADVNNALIEMVKAEVFKVLATSKKNEDGSEATIPVEQLNKIMLAIRRITESQRTQMRMEKEVRRAFVEELSKRLPGEITKGMDGTSEDMERVIRQALTGIANEQ
ncbi:DUF3486 family protein [Vibrio scophthalmi]|uniref:Uncharacterized protein n=2 Tax=Vibrio scophthalmi LMG 19158 TaxID=870967 RepID=F9RNW2_9VIBR|nr:DUF3486 family protein [Vibrio scophthalmi]EGU36638.1 hypothetical protein VIS19158_21927 [Vibrio scophthalmi LMG 19158]